MKYTIILLTLFVILSCSKSENIKQETPLTTTTVFIEEFDNQDHLDEFWEDDSQNESPMNYSIDNGNFKITTRANEVDRVKIKTIKKDFSVGCYTWKIYTSERSIGDKNSIGAFLYNDDEHEIDFEIGSGKVSLRNTLNAQADDLVVYFTAHPTSINPSTFFLIKHNQWHTFKLEITLNESENYIVKWFIDSVLRETKTLHYGLEYNYFAACSLENLGFMGDQLPSQDYSVLFDSFKFEE